jgi:glucose-1-phosphate cytidylyltransferase
MKVILLAGGYGTRLSEYTDHVPKPMIPIGGRPILWHIMRTYAQHGHKDFLIALGYKGEVIKEYFLNYRALNSDFTIDLSNGAVTPHQTDAVDWRVTLVDTGAETLTGGRVKRMRPFIGNDTCLLTYGDGVANIDLEALVAFHRHHGKLVTITAVRPAARFGELELAGEVVTRFAEKPQLGEGWINGGYFVIEPGFFDLIEGDATMLEREPLERAVSQDQLRAYRHSQFWQCMDTKRDYDLLESMWASGNAPWRRDRAASIG